MDFLILRARAARVSKDEEIHDFLVAASPFETPPCGRLLRVRPPYAIALPHKGGGGGPAHVFTADAPNQNAPPAPPCSPTSPNW